MIRVGIVGLGHVATHQIAAIEASDAFELVAGCDTRPDSLSVLDPSVQRFSDVDALLQVADVDVVVVASPNWLHVAHALKVIEAGKWLMVEKPVAPTRDEYNLLAQTLAQGDARCTVSLHAAFGVEMDWFCGQREDGAFADLVVSSFEGHFYDPYVVHGRLEDRALSLSGSWMDSGINALSVIYRILGEVHLELLDGRMTHVDLPGCEEVQGTVDFRFRHRQKDGYGAIDTNWTIGRDQKTTILTSIEPARRIVLDHSQQCVTLQEGGSDQVVFRCENGLPRLTNHYVGVFRDLAAQMAVGKDNFEYCRAMHDHLYEAKEGPRRRNPADGVGAPC